MPVRPKIRRFTLVEMMVVVAIVLVLAAIAVPLVAEYQLKAKRGEAELVTDGIIVAWQAYEHDQGGFPSVACVQSPTGFPSKTLRAWTTGIAFYSTIGFAPDGNVRGVYLAEYNSGVCASVNPCTVTTGDGSHVSAGFVNVDGDTTWAAYYRRNDRNWNETAHGWSTAGCDNY